MGKKRQRRRSEVRRIPTELQQDQRFEGLLDRAQFGTGMKGPRILYHYTSWEAAENIIQTQRFWATAHGCTNDRNELITADAVIMEFARKAHEDARGLCRSALALFLDTFEESRIGSTDRVYLVCFSKKRDDPRQWKDYGSGGAGVCLGLRLFGIPHPGVPTLATGFLPVEYGEEHLRAHLNNWLRLFEDGLSWAPDTRHNVDVAVASLRAMATAWALSTKQKRWENEDEVRMVFLVREMEKVDALEHPRPDGRARKYIEVPLTRLPRIPIDEFIVGIHPDSVVNVRRAVELLTKQRYRTPDRRVAVTSVFMGADRTDSSPQE